MHDSIDLNSSTKQTPQLNRKLMLFLQCAFIASLELAPRALFAVSNMGDLNTNPTNDSTFGALWANVTMLWVIFQAVMALVAALFVYWGSFYIKDHAWGKVVGIWGSALGIALGPSIYLWIQHRAAIQG